MLRERESMVDAQLVRRGIEDARVLAAMRRVPREAFVPAGLEGLAYRDMPLPIEEGQTISQPYMVALMIEAAGVAPGDRVLEIGTGSGYAAAVMSVIADQVCTIERHATLAGSARRRLHGLGYDNVAVRTGDGTEGWPEAAPFSAILAAAGGPDIPVTLRRQLAVGGRLVMPVGSTSRRQRLIKLTRLAGKEFFEKSLGQVAFVPLIGAHGWNEAQQVQAFMR